MSRSMNLNSAEFLQNNQRDISPVEQFEMKRMDVSQLPPGILRESGFELKPQNVESIASVRHENGVVICRIVMRSENEKNPRKEVFFVDYSGAQEVGYVKVHHTEEISFAQNIYTKVEFQKAGLGKQRLVMANQYSIAQYHQPLYSGLMTLKEGRRLWKSLVKAGLAEPTRNLTSHMYRLKTPI